MAAIRLTGPVPGPRSVALMARRKAAGLGGVATLHPIFVAGASGATITDVDGNTFLDFTGGIGVMNAGHADPSVTAAITEQAQRFTHTCFQVMGYESYVALAERLVRITPGRYENRARLHEARGRALLRARLPRPHAARTDAHWQGCPLQIRIWPVRAGSLPAPLPVCLSRPGRPWLD